MAIKISGSTIIDDSRVIVNADKIGIGQTTPRYDLEIFSTGTPTGIAVSSTSSQETDTNKAISIFNNSSTLAFSASYRGRVDAQEYYGTFKGTIDTGVSIDKADTIDITDDTSGSGTHYIHFGSATDGYDGVEVDSTGLIYKDGKLGIGTDNPTSNLQVDGTSLTLINKVDNNNTLIKVENTGTGNAGVKIKNSNGEFTFLANDRLRIMDEDAGGVERISLTSTGKIGVGHTDPQDMVTIRSGDNETTLRLVDPSNNDYGAHFSFYNTENEVRIGGIENTVKRAAIRIDRDADDNSLYISDDGKVGIGTDNPTARLQVYRATEFASNPIIQARSNNGSTNELKFEIDGDGDAYFNGNVGIGTTNPAAILHIHDAAPGIRLSDTGNVGDNNPDPSPYAFAYFDANAANAIIHADKGADVNDSYVAFAVDNSIKVTINDDGDLLRGGTGQDIGASNAKWDNIYANKVYADIEGSITPSGSLTITNDLTVNGNTTLGDASSDSLTVNATSTFNAGVGIADSIFHLGDDNTQIRFPDADTITAETGGDERLRIDSSGHVLIGINASTANDALLQSFKPTGNDSTITVGNVATSASGLARIDFAPSNSVIGARIECHATEDFSTVAKRTADLVFITRKDGTHSEKLRITSDGKVGIGTITPDEALDVNGAIRLRGNNETTYAAVLKANYDSTHTLSLESYHNSSTAFEVIGTHADGGGANVRVAIAKGGQKVGIGTVNPDQFVHILDTSGGNRIMNIEGTGTSGAFLAFLDANTTDDASCRVGTKGGNKLSLRGDEHHFETGVGTSRMVITSSGEVGINTTDPRFAQTNVSSDIKINDAKLGVRGSIVIGNLSETSTDVRELAFYRKNGTYDSTNLNAAIDDHKMGRIAWYGSSNDTNLADKAWSIEVTPDGGSWTDINNRKAFLSFVNYDSTEALRIDSDGKVGIGSTSPREKLDVAAGRIILDQDYQFTWANGTTNRARIYGDSGSNFIVETGVGNTERLRITSTGILELDRGSAIDQAIDIKTTATNGASRIRFVEDGTSKGEVAYSHDNDQLELIARSGNEIVMFTNGTSEKVRINLDGDLLRGGTGQDIGASNAKWDNIYANTVHANVSGTITPSGSITITDDLTVNGNTTLGDASSDSLTVNASSRFIGVTTFINDDGIFIKTSTNQSGAKLKFSDASDASYNQVGHIEYYHNDNEVSPGANEGFKIGGNQTLSVIKVEGRALIDEKVGIGTITPATELDVTGDITIRDETQKEHNVIRTTSDGKLQFLSNAAVNNTVRVTIDDADGNVGIGTSVPTSKFDVHMNDKSGVNFLNISNNSAIDLKANEVESCGRVQVSESNSGGVMILSTKNTSGDITERLRIDSNGNVSISSTAYGGGGTTPELYVRGNGGRAVKIHNPNAGTSSIQLSNATTGQGEDNGFQLAQLGGGDFHFEHQLEAKDIVFRTKPSGGSITERLRITSSGITSITGTDDQDNFMVDVVGTQFAVHTDTTDGEISLRAKDGSGNNYTKYMTFFTEGGSGSKERVRIKADGGTALTRTHVGGRRHTGNTSNYFKIGTWKGFSTAGRAKITVFGTSTFDSGTNNAGESIIYLAFAADNTMHGHFHSISHTRNGIQKVAYKVTNNNQAEVWIKYNGGYAMTKCMADVSIGTWEGNDVNTGSTNTPTGATEANIDSMYAIFTSDGSQSNERLRITSDGKVGINSTSPSNTLVVQEPTDNNSSIQLFRESTGGDIASINWATNQGNQASINYRGGGGSTGMQFYTGGTGSSNLRAIITSSGAVGINTIVDADTKLQVQTDATSTTAGGNIVARFQSNGSGRDATIQLSDNVTHSATISMLSSALIFKQSGTETLQINASGDLLPGGNNQDIGSSSDRWKDIFAVNANFSGTVTYEDVTSIDAVGVITARDHIKFANSGDGIIFGTEGSSDRPSIIGTYASATDNHIVFNTTGTEKLRIDKDGRVGIGTNDPKSELHVENAIGTATTVIISQQKTYGVGSGTAERARLDLAIRETNTTADNRIFGRIETGPESETTSEFSFLAFFTRKSGSISERLRITSGGQVRIANTDITTSSAADDLIIGPNTPAGDRGITIFSGAAGTGNIYFGDTDTSGVGNRMGTISYYHNENYMRFSTNGNQERLRITKDGDVGIGTTNPTSKLTIFGGSIGSGAIDALELKHASSNNSGDGTALLFNSLYQGNPWAFAKISAVNSGSGFGGDLQVHVHPADGTQGSSVVKALSIVGDGSSGAIIRIPNSKVGIGTENPTSNLHVFEQVANTVGVATVLTIHSHRTDMTPDVLAGGAIRFLNSDGNNSGQAFIDANAPSSYSPTSEGNREKTVDFNFRQTNAGTLNTNLTIKGQTGFVGIGSVNPAYTLDFGKSSASTIRLISESNGTAIRIGPGSADNDFTLMRVDGSGANHDGESDDSSHGFSLKYMGSRTNNDNSLSLFADNQQGTQFEAITILQDGNVGIGTATPAYPLEVVGDGGVSISASTDSTNGVLSVVGRNSAGAVSAISRIKSYPDTNSNQSHMAFETRNSSNTMVEAIRINSSQNVGIGTINPTGADALTNNNATLAVGIVTANTIYGNIQGTINPSGSITIADNLTVNGNTTLGDASGDSLTVNATSTFNASASVSGDLDIAADIRHTGNTNTRIRFETDTISFRTDNDERLRIDSSGRVGLGVTPTGIFDIIQDNNPQLTLRSASHADNGGGRLNFAVGVAAAPADGNTMCSIASTIHSTSGGTLKGDMKFYTNGGDDLEQRMVIDSGGRVGIGSVIPTDILDIQTGSSDEVTQFKVKNAGQLELTRNHASAPFIKTLMSSGNPTINLGDSAGTKTVINGHGVSYFNGGDVGIGTNNPTGADALTGNNTTLAVGTLRATSISGTISGTITNATNATNADRIDVSDKTDDANTFIVFTSGATGNQTPHTNTNLTFNSTDGAFSLGGGVLNLGTADTSSGHINSAEVLTFNIDTDNDDTNRYFAFYKNSASGSGTELVRITESGEVGIGTISTVANAKLDVWGDGSEYPTLRLGTEAYNTEGEDIRFGRIDHPHSDIRYHSIYSFHHATAANNYLKFSVHKGSVGANNTLQEDVMYLKGDGNVGIGSEIPSQKLDVAGTVKATAFEGPITGTLTGAASKLKITNQASDETCFPVFVQASTGDTLDPHANTSLTFNASTGQLGATSFSGGLPITDGADNRIITATSGSAIKGESNLTFDGSTLSVTGDADPVAVFDRGSANNTNLNLKYNGSHYGQVSVADREFQLSAVGSSTTFKVYVNNDERFVIDTNGNIGVNATPKTSGSLYDTVDHFLVIGDNDTGIAQDGDGQFEIWANNQEIANFNASDITLKKTTTIEGNLTVDGTVTYEDVTNVSTTGIITASTFIATGGTVDSGTENDPTNVAMMLELNDYIYSNDSVNSKRRIIGKSKSLPTANPANFEVIEIGQTGTALIDQISIRPGNAGDFRVVTGGATGYPASHTAVRVSAGGTLSVRDTNPKDVHFEVKSDKGMLIRTDTNTGSVSGLSGSLKGAKLLFSDSSSVTQVGHIVYKHSDNSITPGTNEGFIIGGDQGTSSNPTVVKVEGRVIVDEKVGIGTNDPLHPLHIFSTMGSSPSFIHMQVTGSNTVGGGGGIAFDTSASESDTTKYIATIAGIRNSANNGSNDLVFSTTKANAVGDDGNNHTPKERLRITMNGGIAFSGASNYGTSGQILKSNGDAPPTWVNSSTTISGVVTDVKQYKVGSTERSCTNPITVSSGTIGISSASNAFGARYISTEASGGTYCDGDIWYDTTGTDEELTNSGTTTSDIFEATKFFQNPTSLTQTTTFPTSGSKNGGVFGPYEIANGVTFTISSGSTFTII